MNLLKQRGGNLGARGANLSLQDHGDPVWYRNIRLRTLSESDPIDLAYGAGTDFEAVGKRKSWKGMLKAASHKGKRTETFDGFPRYEP